MRRAVLCALVALACACHNEHATDAGKTSTIASPPQLDSPASKSSGTTKATQTVELTEYSIRMPQTLAAGPQSLTIVNGGKEMHSFQIEGNGVQMRLPADLPRGDSSKIDLDLKPGTYTIWCPVDGHKGKGMTTTVTVQ